MVATTVNEKPQKISAGLAGIDDPKQKVVTAKASLIRSTMRGKTILVELNSYSL